MRIKEGKMDKEAKNEFVVKMPILGFENVQKMRLVAIAEMGDDDTFLRLESCENDGISFTLINPFKVRNDYIFEVPKPARVLLAMNGEQNKNEKDPNLITLNTFCTDKDITKSTINFLAPILFNFENHTMAQIVLDGFVYENFGIDEPISKFFDFSGEQK